MLKLSSVALSWGVALISLPAFAKDPAAPPEEPPVDAGPPPADAPPAPAPTPEAPRAAAPIAEAEMKKLLEELQAEERSRAQAPAIVPDLSKVNLAAGIPGIQSMNPNLAVILNAGVASYGVAVASAPGSAASDEPLRTGGHDLDHSGFTLQQVELAIGASVDPYLRFDSNLVFKEGVEVEEAYATSLNLPLNLQARGGAFYSHFGRQNEQHPHQWAFIDQPLIYGLMLGEDGHHGIGGEVSWLSPLPWSLVVIASAQDSSGACCSITFSPKEEPVPVNSPLDVIYTAAVEQFFPVTDDLSVLWGLSAQAGPATYFADAGRAELWGTDLLVRYKPTASEGSRWCVDLQAEALVRTRHAPGEALVEDDGGYVHLLWYPSWDYAVGVRYDLAQERLDDDPANPGLGPQNQRGALLLHWAPSHFSRVRLTAAGGTRGQGDLLWGVMAALEVSIGAHGAHAF